MNSKNKQFQDGRSLKEGRNKGVVPVSVDREKIQSTHLPVRLQKLLAEAGVGSRRGCEELIKEGRVTLNGHVISQLGTKAIPEVDQVAVDGTLIRLPQKVLFLFHKPRSVVTSMNDPQGRQHVGQFTKDLGVRVFPVGRLDYDVSGLLLLTNDGEFGHRLTHPQFGVKRTYVARVRGVLSEKKQQLLDKGILLPDGFARVASIKRITPSSLSTYLLGATKVGEDLLEVVVNEGRNHFVKNILDAVGTPVVKLSRTAFGPFLLSDIKRGTLREVALKEELFG